MWHIALLYISAWVGRGWWMALLLLSVHLAYYVYVYPVIDEGHWKAFNAAQEAFTDVVRTVVRQQVQRINQHAFTYDCRVCK